MGNSFHILSKSPHIKQVFHLRVSENRPVAADEDCPELAVTALPYCAVHVALHAQVNTYANISWQDRILASKAVSIYTNTPLPPGEAGGGDLIVSKAGKGSGLALMRRFSH